MRMIWSGVIAVTAITATCAAARADVLLQTATLGTEGFGSGSVSVTGYPPGPTATAVAITGTGNANEAATHGYIGARFTVSQTTSLESIAVHMLSNPRFFMLGGQTLDNHNNGQFFAAIVPLASLTAVPQNGSLTDAIYHTVFEMPENTPSQRVVIPVTVGLTPGIYGVVFGSGLFGTRNGAFRGIGYAPLNNSTLGTPSLFGSYGSGSGVPGSFVNYTPGANTYYLQVNSVSVPEPAPAALVLSALPLVGFLVARKRGKNRP